MPKVSVVIPAYNEERVIGRLLLSLHKQSRKSIEIIVVDDASTDNTVGVARKYTRKVFTRTHAERSVQRNFGASNALGKYLFFVDADMELSVDVIKECVDLVEYDHKIGAVVIPEKSIVTNFWEKVKSFERSIYNLEGDESLEAARFFPKAVFDEAGGYDEHITGPEDWDLPETIKKLGYKVGRTRSVITHYERIPSLFSLLRKKYYYALKSHRYLSKQKISVVSPKTVFFIRPVFYRNWRTLLCNPIMTVAMIIMLTAELFAGGAGFVVGKVRGL